MTWHAIDSVGKAFDKSIGLLFRPFRAKFWLKLALVALLMGFGGGGGGNFGNVGNIGDGDFGNLPEVIMENIGIIVAAGLLVILLALILSYIKAVMQFLFLESVLNSRVDIRAGFKRHMGNGFRLFLFELALGIMVVLCIIVPALAYYLVFGIGSGMALWAPILLAILALLLLAISVGIITSFTKAFVVPYMYKGMGIIEGWRRLLSVLRKNISQTLVYILARIVLGIASAIAGIIIAIPVVLVLAIPGIIIGLFLVGIGLSGLCSGAMVLGCIITAILLLIPGILVVSYIFTLAGLPIPVFFRYYTLIFLTKIDPGFEIWG